MVVEGLWDGVGVVVEGLEISQLFYLFCSSIVINTVIVTAGNFEPQ